MRSVGERMNKRMSDLRTMASHEGHLPKDAKSTLLCVMLVSFPIFPILLLPPAAALYQTALGVADTANALVTAAEKVAHTAEVHHQKWKAIYDASEIKRKQLEDALVRLFVGFQSF